MGYIVGFFTVFAVLAFLAGYFLGVAPILILATGAGIACFWMYMATREATAGTSGGIGPAFLMLGLGLFEIVLIATAVLVRVPWDAVSWTSLWHGLGRLLFR